MHKMTKENLAALFWQTSLAATRQYSRRDIITAATITTAMIAMVMRFWVTQLLKKDCSMIQTSFTLGSTRQ